MKDSTAGGRRNERELLLDTKTTSNDNLAFNNGPIVVPSENGSVTGSRETDNNVKFNFNGPLKMLRWTMMGSSWASLEYEYQLNGSYPFTGVSFNYPENYILGAKWLGKGLSRQWKNRTANIPVNVWENLYNDTKKSIH